MVLKPPPGPSPTTLRPTVIGCGCASPTAAGLVDPVAQAGGDSGEWFKLAITLVFAGQGMVFGLGYNLAREAGEAPGFGSTLYWVLHGGLVFSALVSLALLGRPLFRATWLALRVGKVTIEALFTLSLAGALAGSLVSTFTGQTSVYYEIVAIVLVIYTVGRLLGARQRRKVEGALADLRDAFATAYVRQRDGTRREVPVRLVNPATDFVEVHPGEAIAVDGVIIEGRGFVQETSLSGEPDAVARGVGEGLWAGTYSVDGRFVLRPTEVGERRLDQVLGMVEQAGERPSRLQAQADQLMVLFVPFVATVAVLTFGGWLLAGFPWWRALFQAMAVLLVACPCALGLATPLAVWRALYGLRALGLVPRAASVIDGFAQADGVIWDKTGTLSEGVLAVVSSEFAPNAGDPSQIRAAVASIESLWPHPVARALATLAETRLPVAATRLLPGLGVEAEVAGATWRIGQAALLPAARPAWAASSPGREIWALCNGVPVACFALRERLRADAESALQELADMGLRAVVLTGDPSPAWTRIGPAPVEAGLDPLQKQARVTELCTQGRWLYVGDGLNDAAAMTAGATAIALDSGAALTRSTADAVLLGDSLAALPQALRLGRRVRQVVHGNLRFAATYNLIGMGLAAGGWLHPVVAALLMVISSFLVSARALAVTKNFVTYREKVR